MFGWEGELGLGSSDWWRSRKMGRQGIWVTFSVFKKLTKSGECPFGFFWSDVNVNEVMKAPMSRKLDVKR